MQFVKGLFQSQFLVKTFIAFFDGFVVFLYFCLIVDNLAMDGAESISDDMAVGFFG